MAYTRKHNYKSMRERNQNVWRKTKVAVIVFLIALVVYAIKNRYWLQDYIMTYFWEQY